MKQLSLVAATVIWLLPAATALAQQNQGPGVSPGNQGVGGAPADPKEVQVPERGSLPAAGGTMQSSAPGMAADCTKDASACSEPVQGSRSSSQAPGMPAQSK